ncbi:MAG: hypothetical protein ACLRSW_05480 [Christensenellaceae bacterium]
MICAALCAAMILPLAACKPEGTINPGAEHTLVSVYAADTGRAGSRRRAAFIRKIIPTAFKIEANNRAHSTPIKTTPRDGYLRQRYRADP